jgi:hypothetical protein
MKPEGHALTGAIHLGRGRSQIVGKRMKCAKLNAPRFGPIRLAFIFDPYMYGGLFSGRDGVEAHRYAVMVLKTAMGFQLSIAVATVSRADVIGDLNSRASRLVPPPVRSLFSLRTRI